MVGVVIWRTGLVGLHTIDIAGKPGAHWWRILTAAFVYNNTGYAFVTLGAIALFGWLLERRHGPLPVITLFLVGGVGGLAVAAAAYPEPLAMGANGAALALITAWALPDLLALRSREEVDGDLIGTAAIFAVLALLPLAAREANWLAEGVGVAAGLVIGYPLARLDRR
jgi:membrane associated rhomboid family serine protease